MEVMEAILTRHSTRSFTDKPVPKETLEEIASAGTYAASGRNRQPVLIVAVTNPELIAELSRINAEIMGTEGDPFYGAPAVLVVLADKSVPTYLYDGSLVMGNMMLAATDLNLGNCWIHRAKETFEREDVQAILDKLGIKGDYEGIGNLVVGYPASPNTECKPRKDGRVIFAE